MKEDYEGIPNKTTQTGVMTMRQRARSYDIADKLSSGRIKSMENEEELTYTDKFSQVGMDKADSILEVRKQEAINEKIKEAIEKSEEEDEKKKSKEEREKEIADAIKEDRESRVTSTTEAK